MNMAAILEWTHTVVEGDLDGLGHANNISYLKWMQSAALEHSAVQGWPAERYAELGFGWVVRSHFIEYLSPALLGDTIVVRTWVGDMRKVTSLRRFKILASRAGELVAILTSMVLAAGCYHAIITTDLPPSTEVYRESFKPAFIAGLVPAQLDASKYCPGRRWARGPRSPGPPS